MNPIRRVLLALAAAMLCSFSSAAVPRPVVKGVYGQDDRLDVFQVDDAKKALADSVASLWDPQLLEYDPRSGAYHLITRSFSDKMGLLCPSEPFRDQPTGPVCTATLVGEDLLLTAGHCVPDLKECAKSWFVFGFAIKDPAGAAPSSVPPSEVYSCAEVVDHYENRTSTRAIRADYALVRLDRKVTGHRIVPIARDDGLAKGDAVFMLGYPSGLPLKVVGGATVRSVSDPGFFLADLDAFGGNSGSPIFNERTNAIEGVLFAGDQDFGLNEDETCVVVARRGQNEGSGEAATKASLLRALIPVPGSARRGAAPARSSAAAPRPEQLTSWRELSGFSRYEP